MPFKTWLPSINQKTENILDNNPEMEKDYPSYVVNQALAFDPNCLLFVNEINKLPDLSNLMQYQFYFHALPKAKRFNKWIKAEKEDYLDVVKSYYKCSTKKAREYLNVLTKDQINIIIERQSRK